MLLRKHLSGGRITEVEFFDYERIVSLVVESLTELGDLTVKKLIIEVMGRYSNIILVNQDDKIIDSIKHIDNETSSVREVMPARQYILPPSQGKQGINDITISDLIETVRSEADTSIEKVLLNNIKGFSPLLCREICFRSGIEAKLPVKSITEDKWPILKVSLEEIFDRISANGFIPCIIPAPGDDDGIYDYHCLDIRQYDNTTTVSSISLALDMYYSAKDNTERLKQKKSDILRVLTNNIDRCNKKAAIQNEKLREVSDRESLKLFGELLTANIYCIPANVKKVSLYNYYSENGEKVEIALDDTLSPQANAQRYFKQYSKAKAAYAHTSRQLEENLKELEYLESVLHLLSNCNTLGEIDEVRQELIEQGYITNRRKGPSKKKDTPSKPLHFRSSDGLDIFIGKNNRQNDQLTLKTSSSNDIWLHTREIPGSHVIIKKLQGSIPDRTLLEAGILAAYHSKAGKSSTVPVDYTSVKNVKKPNGAKPGMVIYENFKTIIVTPDEDLVKKLKSD